MIDPFEDESQLQSDSWKILSDKLSNLDTEIPGQIAVPQLLDYPICKTLATLFLQTRKGEACWKFLNTDQLVSIASKEQDAEKDIDLASGVYIFLALADGKVLKVGQSEDMRKRIAKEHLRKTTMNTLSLLIDYAKRTWDYAGEWHESLRSHEVTALLFRMDSSDEDDRLLIEHALQAALNPLMP